MEQQLTIQYVSRSEIKRRPGNPRTHSPDQVRQIARSILEVGFANPCLVDEDIILIAGHGRLDAADYLQLPQIPIIVLAGLSDVQKRGLVIADNQLALNAGWDEAMLRIELQALQDSDFDLTLVGFDDDELARLLAAEEAAPGLTDEDDVPDIAETPITMTGDRWIMGNHVLLVGDATVPADVDRLMAGELADMVFEDLPYNVGYTGYTKEELTIQNDSMSPEQFKQFLLDAFRCTRRAMKPTAGIYVCHASSWQREFQNAMEAAGFIVRYQIIWVKNTFAWGFGRLKFQHEPIFLGYCSGHTDAWYGDKTQSTVWEENKPAANRTHPNSKPPAIMERALLNSSKAGGLCLDLFAGSGSTLIACERRGRKTRVMEIDPRYADVICRRYQEYTGKKATLDDDGRTFDEIAEERRKAVA